MRCNRALLQILKHKPFQQNLRGTNTFVAYIFFEHCISFFSILFLVLNQLMGYDA